MNLRRFTRELEECRRRWHHHCVRYVLGVARIVRAARTAAKTKRRWGAWIKNEIHMDRTTVYRYLRVADFLKSNVSVQKHLSALSLGKIYYLSRLKRQHAFELIKSGKAELLSEAALIRLVQRLKPRVVTRATLPNLRKSTDAALHRLERSMKRWQHSTLTMPAAYHMRLQSRLLAMSKALEQLGSMSAVAM